MASMLRRQLSAFRLAVVSIHVALTSPPPVLPFSQKAVLRQFLLIGRCVIKPFVEINTSRHVENNALGHAHHAHRIGGS